MPILQYNFIEVTDFNINDNNNFLNKNILQQLIGIQNGELLLNYCTEKYLQPKTYKINIIQFNINDSKTIR